MQEPKRFGSVNAPSSGTHLNTGRDPCVTRNVCAARSRQHGTQLQAGVHRSGMQGKAAEPRLSCSSNDAECCGRVNVCRLRQGPQKLQHSSGSVGCEGPTTVIDCSLTQLSNAGA